MTLVYHKALGGPATHAIVIGVGAYKHLVDGHGKLFQRHEGMGQLKSPPHSAEAFSDWLTSKYNNPDRKLASVELLVSDGSRTGKETASTSNAVRAIQSWIKRGDENQDNLMIFFFCGHGMSRTPVTSLLLDDYGANKLSPLNNAIDFYKFHFGMDRCNALKQCYFIDACRTTSGVLLDTYGYSGVPIIAPPSYLSGTHRMPAYYSTAPSAAAYGREDANSFFTEALIRTLNGAGGNKVNGEWWVSSVGIHLGIQALMKKYVWRVPLVPQLAEVDNLSEDFPVHLIGDEPIVPVTVGCDPNEANQEAELSISSNGHTIVRRYRREPSEWEVELKPDKYEFEATFPSRSFINGKMSEVVWPPIRRVSIKVGRGGS